jgi:hypothetical protein
MPNVRGTVKTPVKQLPRPLPGEGILRAVRASASSTTVSQDGRCEAKIAMTGSGCAVSAETGAGDAVVLTQGVEKPRAPDKTVRVTAEAHDVATTRAREAGTDRKTVVSEMILNTGASPGVNADLPQLKAKALNVIALLLGEIEKAIEGEPPDLDLLMALGPLTVKFVHELPRLAAIREKSSSGAPAVLAKLKEVCYPEPERLKEWQRWRESLAAGDHEEK